MKDMIYKFMRINMRDVLCYDEMKIPTSHKVMLWLRWLVVEFLTFAASVWYQIKSFGVYGGQGDTGAGYLRVLQFLLPTLILRTAPH